ncbi:SH3 domain-containing protein [Falsibacillus albus]|uniref:N-acetylmuramoyl-L-alanine amidase n=1 Tax=Falsibacillus albus TaxID=2478915 RepID=A0A3L7K4Y4_9BACI|nr:SH3 domain-containing protein [Falsibacillus albus]RLQ98097.1 N-acetylmuramoyl-L-alanine amidase [Falsibacillus albus]
MGKKGFSTLLIILLAFSSFMANASVAAAGGEKVKIGVSPLNVREGPGLTYSVISQIHKGETYSMVGKQGDWIQIELSPFKKGWVASWLVSKVGDSTAASSSGNTGKITVDSLRLRSGPSTSDSILSILSKNDTVEIIQASGNWLKIKANGQNGWVYSSYVQKTAASNSQSSPAGAESASSTGIITAEYLNARSKPDTESEIVGSLRKGDKVGIISSQSGWDQIQYGGDTAWISDRYVETASTSSTGSKSSSDGDSHSALTATVNVSGLNVRSTPSLNGQVIGTVNTGESYQVAEEQNDWIKIKLNSGQYGWVAGWFMEKSLSSQNNEAKTSSEGNVTVLYNGTNIRQQPSVQSSIVQRANAGDTFKIKSSRGDWLEIYLSNGQTAFIAGWIVSSGNVESNHSGKQNPSNHGSIEGKTIIIDPGHGGRDNGTTGNRGTLEKMMTLQTAQLLYDKLSNAGANVMLTRSDDRYVSLPSRVSVAQSQNADAFISIHFDSSSDHSVNGHTTYYYHDYQQSLADALDAGVSNQIGLRDRGVRFGDFHVIRENSQPATLMELGYLSNSTEEATILSKQYKELVSTGIYNGLVNYFH